MKNKYDVLLILEGTYPYNGGGVSTWAHMLCNEVKNAEFLLYSINAQYESQPKYALSPNIKSIVQVPLWSPLEPQEMVHYGKNFHTIVDEKEKLNEGNINEDFIPIFRRLIANIYSDTRKAEDFDDIIYKMWLFFQENDYKKTMQSMVVWRAFCNLVRELSQNTKGNRNT